MAEKHIVIPTVAFYISGDGSTAFQPMPGLSLLRESVLAKAQELVRYQIAQIEADKTERNLNEELRNFRLGWYGTGELMADLGKPPSVSAQQHLLIAVQDELCGKEDQAFFEDIAVSQVRHLRIWSGAPGNRVFIIHGRDEDSLTRLAAFVQKRGYEPLILSRIPVRGAETIIEKLEQTLPQADIIVALFTPDDEGRLRGSETQLTPRARQNVLVEAGYALIQRRSDSIIITLGDTEVPSDLSGILRIQAEAWDYGVEQQLGDSLPVVR